MSSPSETFLSYESICEILNSLESGAFSAIEAIQNAEELEKKRVELFGRKSDFTLVLKSVGKLSGEQRAEAGKRANLLKRGLEEALDGKKNACKNSPQPVKSGIDATLPGIRSPRGAEHPIQHTVRQIVDIFEKLNFEWVDGPEVETTFHNFTALNVPENHPARDPLDTFFTPQGNLLRTQTSTVQIRVMQERKPPVRVIAPGRVYRPDTVDASHSFMFHQIEGLMVDEDVTFADLKGLLYVFLRRLFGKNVEIRFRPHFFPFTEPSVEVDMRWGNRWLEILGAGCVDPNVFKAVGYDPKKTRGFAFGLGVERMAMIKYGINDIRLFYENDLRFLEQFR